MLSAMKDSRIFIRDSSASDRDTFFSRYSILVFRWLIVVVWLVVVASSSSTRVFCLPSRIL